jgi:cation diffusion facilitator family transporter
VIALTATMMVAEIVAGSVFGSMALTADGWHMASHASALGIAVFAYGYARWHASDARYSFGTGKVSVLGGYTSAVVLAVIALWIAGESLARLFSAVSIRFDEAIGVAAVGLAVNVLCAYVLRDEHGEGHAGHDPVDHNRRAAYLHVLADALTSALAIVALVAGKALGWVWMDPAMGLVGSVIIARWSYGLLRDTSGVLLDGSSDAELAGRIRSELERGSDRVTDLHLWQLGPADRAAIVAIVTHDARPPETYRRLLQDRFGLAHVTVEVHPCPAA